MSKILNRIKKIFKEILPAFVFFFLMFNILVITRSLILRQFGIIAPSSAFALVWALIMAKVIIIADRIPVLNLYPKKPLIWNIMLKTIVFGAFAIFFLIAEEFIRQARTHGGFSIARDNFSKDFVWTAFFVREIWLNVLLFFYCFATEFTKVVGTDRVKEIIFGKKRKETA